jgi:S-methylmethionine-dependent homocysteine/selenocysteine methylase
MDDKGWSCAVQLFHPDAVRDVHADYIKAGSDVVTACTYASNRCVLASVSVSLNSSLPLASSTLVLNKAP